MTDLALAVQAYYSRALSPMLRVTHWLVPLAIGGAGVRVVLRRRIGRSDRDVGKRLVQRQEERDRVFLLVGAAVGYAASLNGIAVWSEGRLGEALVLPVAGAAVGLIVSALTPLREPTGTTMATLSPRRLSDYAGPRPWQILVATSAVSVAIAVVNAFLPRDHVLAGLSPHLRHVGLAPTPDLYLVLAVLAFALCIGTRCAAEAIARRSRPTGDAETLEGHDWNRSRTIRQLIAWSTAAVVLLDAAMITVFPRKMGGVVFGNVQLIQRATDVVTVVLVAGAAGIVLWSYRVDASAQRSSVR